MLLYCHQNVGQNRDRKIAYRQFENVSQFKYLEMTVTNRKAHLLSKSIKIKIYKTIILPVVLHGCETWFLTLREEHGPRVFENRVLRRIFEPKRDGGWRKLHNEELCDLYSLASKIRIIEEDEMGGACNTNGEEEHI
jgi:hypothetical protein